MFLTSCNIWIVSFPDVDQNQFRYWFYFKISLFLPPFETFWNCCLENYPTLFPPCLPPSWVINDMACITINTFFTGHSSIFKGSARIYITAEAVLDFSSWNKLILYWLWLLEPEQAATTSDRVPRLGEGGLFYEVVWYLHRETTDVYHERWTNASKQCWLQSRVNCPSSTPFTSRPTHVINPGARGVMSASRISLHWLRPKFLLQCQMNGPGFDFPSKKPVWHCLASDWFRTTATVKRQSCFYPSYWKYWGWLAGNEHSMSSLWCVHCSLCSILPSLSLLQWGWQKQELTPCSQDPLHALAGWPLSLVWPRARSNPHEDAGTTSPMLVLLSCWRKNTDEEMWHKNGLYPSKMG